MGAPTTVSTLRGQSTRSTRRHRTFARRERAYNYCILLPLSACRQTFHQHLKTNCARRTDFRDGPGDRRASLDPSTGRPHRRKVHPGRRPGRGPPQAAPDPRNAQGCRVVPAKGADEPRDRPLRQQVKGKEHAKYWRFFFGFVSLSPFACRSILRSFRLLSGHSPLLFLGSLRYIVLRL